MLKKNPPACNFDHSAVYVEREPMLVVFFIGRAASLNMRTQSLLGAASRRCRKRFSGPFSLVVTCRSLLATCSEKQDAFADRPTSPLAFAEPLTSPFREKVCLRKEVPVSPFCSKTKYAALSKSHLATETRGLHKASLVQHKERVKALPRAALPAAGAPECLRIATKHRSGDGFQALTTWSSHAQLPGLIFRKKIPSSGAGPHPQAKVRWDFPDLVSFCL